MGLQRLPQALYQALRHHAHQDEANAALHCAPVRFSPITFRLAEALADLNVFLDEHPEFDAPPFDWSTENDPTISATFQHLYTYDEDKGR